MDSNPEYLDALVEWAAGWDPADCLVTLHRSPTDWPKLSAWVQVERSDVVGQVTVWDSGECEAEVYRTVRGEDAWLEHFDFESTDALLEAMDRFAAFFGDPSK